MGCIRTIDCKHKTRTITVQTIVKFVRFRFAIETSMQSVLKPINFQSYYMLFQIRFNIFAIHLGATLRPSGYRIAYSFKTLHQMPDNAISIIIGNGNGNGCYIILKRPALTYSDTLYWATTIIS